MPPLFEEPVKQERDLVRDAERWEVAPELIRSAPEDARWRLNRTVPSDLNTLAEVSPGQIVEVRSILSGAGETAALLRPGDVLTCRGRTVEWLVVDQPGHGELAVHRHDAGLVQIEWHDRHGLG